MYNKDGYYNIAVELLVDDNNLGFSGLDMIRFGKEMDQILYRETISFLYPKRIEKYLNKGS